MRAPGFSISPHDLWSLIGSAQAPQIVDARRREFYDASDSVLPTAVWRDIAALPQWSGELDRTRPVILACKANKEMSQTAAAQLRADGFDARVLEDGYAGWAGAGFPLIDKNALQRFAGKRPSVWVTRRRPKIDRVACPWLIRRFVDAEARILFVDPAHVTAVAAQSGGTPFDIADVELSHEGERCSFDTMLKVFGLEGEASLARLAPIVRGADTARPDLAPEAAGLHAVSLGLSALAGDDDHGMLRHGFIVYDALFAWLRFADEERHNWPAKAA
jgi:rhodanese-related sulfurtransferase